MCSLDWEDLMYLCTYSLLGRDDILCRVHCVDCRSGYLSYMEGYVYVGVCKCALLDVHVWAYKIAM